MQFGFLASSCPIRMPAYSMALMHNLTFIHHHIEPNQAEKFVMDFFLGSSLGEKFFYEYAVDYLFRSNVSSATCASTRRRAKATAASSSHA